MESLLLSKKPHLKAKTIKTYASNLQKLCKVLKYEQDITSLMHKEKCRVLLYLASLPSNRVKQACSALLLLFPDETEIKDMIAHARVTFQQKEERQELSAAQKLAWKSWDSILERRKQLEEECILLWPKLNLSCSEYMKLHDYVMCCVYTYIAPRRCVDFCLMSAKLDEEDNEKNFIVHDDDCQYFVFNQYKTSKTYGCQTILIPNELWKVLREWLKINQSEWLFHVSMNNLNALRPDQMSRRLAQVFNQARFGVNLLRHAYVSDQIMADVPFITELKRHAYELGHSPEETMLYKKRL
jgi:hypothetical protein